VNGIHEFFTFLAGRRAELLTLTGQHLVLVMVSTSLAIAIGFPLGVALTRSPRLAGPVLAVAGVFQTLPSLALFGFLIPLPILGGIGPRSAIVALVLYALLPILRNTYAGLRGVEPAVLEAATGLGMTPFERLRLVEVPLALPTILAGVRIATVVSVGTATIAAAIGAGGLGTYVFRGLATVDTRLILAGAIPSALMAVGADGLLGAVERSRRPGRAGAALAAFVAALALFAGWPGRSVGRSAVVVGSKNFTEQVILGEILSALLESRGFPVERRLNLGGTSICHEALRSGRLDAYVEYTGTALTDILKMGTTADPRIALERVQEGYRGLGLRLGAPLGFDDTFALVVRRGFAKNRGVNRISDLAPLARTLRVGLFGEFLERADGMAGLLKAYGLELRVPPREMDLGLLYAALVQDQVDVVVGNSTDGLISRLDLVGLEDDRHFFPPYDAVPVTSEGSLVRHPGLLSALDELDGRIGEASMRQMNDAVDDGHRSPRDVAIEFLRGAHLVAAGPGPNP
jgi:osmoprotectant transport system permease protein